MFEVAFPKLLEYGWPGIIVVLLLYAIKKLVDVITDRDLVIITKDKEINDLQEKRIAEAMKSVVVLAESSAAHEASANVLRQVAFLMERSKLVDLVDKGGKN